MYNKIYRLKEEYFFEDNNSVNIDVDLKFIEKDSELFKFETLNEHQIKRVFWINKEKFYEKKDND